MSDNPYKPPEAVNEGGYFQKQPRSRWLLGGMIFPLWIAALLQYLLFQRMSYLYSLKIAEVFLFGTPLVLLLSAIFLRGPTRTATIVNLIVSGLFLCVALCFDSLEGRVLPRDSVIWFSPLQLIISCFICFGFLIGTDIQGLLNRGSDERAADIERWRESLNLSQLFMEAFDRAVAANASIPSVKGKEMKTVVERLRKEAEKTTESAWKEGAKEGREWATKHANLSDLRNIAEVFGDSISGG